ncbi:peptidoglycan DD-metalloendopeptidase family protein [Petroclostridium sp. X23]|uniref:peptidoglycan DD-metalloendopeptidase family protein n=1 Tax=Petroclostridium sp. X23 TaxID=3045146 RepID=UPI0024ADFF0D|nr:peptidoglycan DD-metalloendopeptidase family protein [Petroclostridium sp. X23]WHH61089.1 peptidoglycan DD-metalloendopeptidase family protein [Petroclostridium sp. X23]
MINIADKLKKHKFIIPAIAFMLTTSTASGIVLSNTAYAIKVDEQVVGVVKHKTDAYQIIEEIKGKYQNQFDGKIIIPEKITDERVFTFTFKNKVSSIDEIRTELEKSIQIYAEAYALSVDGKDLVFVKDEQSAQTILQRIKDEFSKEVNPDAVKELDFVEKVDITKKDVPIDKIADTEAAFTHITAGENKAEEYIVKDGDTIWDIAVSHHIDVEDIQKLNPHLDIARLQIDQKITLVAAKPFINVKSVETVTYEEKIPYDIKYEESASLYLGDKKVKTNGADGKKKIVAEVVKINGTEISKNILEDTVLQQAQTEIILKGTKKRPLTMAYGTFRNPATGILTSRFGSRWGSQHTGIDIAGAIGTPVTAADGGKAIFAGASGSGYGNLIIIDHGNGYQTYYAHLNTIKIKKGDSVYKGQNIATVGATGKVTGPHLHFEVRKNGSPIDPLQYVSY